MMEAASKAKVEAKRVKKTGKRKSWNPKVSKQEIVLNPELNMHPKSLKDFLER
jgi:hypothetical protein